MITNKERTEMKSGDRIRYLREKLSLERAYAPGLQFKVASNLHEVTSAFKLVHQAYVEFGYIQPTPSGLRLTKQHALPTTTTLVALEGNRVVATASIVQDNPLGLPMDACFDLSGYRQRGRIAEVSNFAVAKDYRGDQGQVSIPLCRFIYEYTAKALRNDFMVIAVNPVHVDFYEAIMMFERMPTNTVAEYSAANGKPAVGLALDLGAAALRWQEVSRGVSEERNLYRYFCRDRFSNFQIPESSFHQGWHSPMNPKWLELFFDIGVNDSARLSEPEWAIVKASYGLRLPSSQTFPIRQETRYPVNGYAQVLAGPHLIDIRNASKNGALLFSPQALPLNETLSAEVCVGPGVYCTATVTPVRLHGDRLYGARVTTKGNAWTKFIDYLQQTYPRAESVSREMAEAA